MSEFEDEIEVEPTQGALVTVQGTTFKNLKVLQPNGMSFNDGEVSIMIERDDEAGLVYDALHPTDKTFKAENLCTNPFIPLKKGTGRKAGRLEASVPLDPAVFIDGDYLVSFVDTRFPTNPVKDVMAMASITVFDGSTSTRKIPQIADIVAAIKANVPTPASLADITTALGNVMKDTKVTDSFGALLATRIIRLELAKHTLAGTLGLALNNLVADVKAIKTKVGA